MNSINQQTCLPARQVNKSTDSWYIDVILPLPLQGLFTYQIADHQLSDAKPGVRVVVPVGKKRLYTALIHHVHQQKPQDYMVRPVHALLDSEPVINDLQLKLWEWIADYYMCTLGDIYRAAVPAGFKPEKEIYKPRKSFFIRLGRSWREEVKLHSLLDKLAKAPRQHKLLMQYLETSGFSVSSQPVWIEKTTLLKKAAVSDSVFQNLVKKKVFETTQRVVSRLSRHDDEIREPLSLTGDQSKALQSIKQNFMDKDVVLLHGITSSGKTEMYIHLIRDQLEKGKQVLYLLPEIALTTQIITRLRKVFGNKVGIYHSKFSASERVEIWNCLAGKTTGIRDPYQVILGARSSLFLPFSNLGLVIIDEEHENTFKQTGPSPRYHARDTAIVLAQLHKAKVLLGSATPSLESFYNCLTGKYGLVELSKRYLDLQLPEIHVVNIHEAYRKKQMKSHFSVPLLEATENALKQHEQVILFQNRRGFSLFLECGECGWVPRCIHCDVSLTYHKRNKSLVCHYCGYSVSVYGSCKKCGSHNMQMKGFGTEKIEDEIALFFPGARITRMDLDAIRSRKTCERIIAAFERGEIDIMVGTQMISKGLDFDNVNLVGILNADNMLNYPDFRAYERSFQLMLQVSGRAGRKNRRGRVIIQAYDSSQELFNQVINHDFNSFARSQLSERKSFHYPPYTRLIEITLKSKDKNKLDRAAEILASILKKQLDIRIMGPEYPLISKIRNHHLKRIILKTKKEKSVARVKETLQQCIAGLHRHDDFRGVMVSVDVDPA
ncbi:MAG: primosomal protein N' [Bacteroidales bacterium]|nr:primosomal protein N' [Bacteroidales bacterium]